MLIRSRPWMLQIMQYLIESAGRGLDGNGRLHIPSQVYIDSSGTETEAGAKPAWEQHSQQVSLLLVADSSGLLTMCMSGLFPIARVRASWAAPAAAGVLAKPCAAVRAAGRQAIPVPLDELCSAAVPRRSGCPWGSMCGGCVRVDLRMLICVCMPACSRPPYRRT